VTAAITLATILAAAPSPLPSLGGSSVAPLPSASPAASPTPAPSQFGAGVVTFSFLLSLLIWAPVVMAFVIAIFPRGPRGRFLRWPLGFAFWTMLLGLFLALVAYSQFQSFTSGLQFEEREPWLPDIGVSYHLGVDGISMTVLVLNYLAGLVAVLASWEVRARAREYFAFLLLAQAAVSGVVAARDFFLLFLFWTAAAVPVALLVGGWGSSRGWPAAGRVLGYWGAGSGALLVAGLLLYQAAGGSDFDLDTLAKAQIPTSVQVVAGALLLAAAATRLPLAPLHGWARELFAEAPAGVAILVAGSASRLGGYLLIRLLAGIEHDGSRALAPWIGALAGLTVIYAALAALRSQDVRRLAAYLALVPGGVTALGVSGLSPLSLHGAVLSLFAGGLAAAMVVGAGATFAERAGTRSLALVGGLTSRMPVITALLVVAGLAAVGVPFLATFASGVMVFLGSFRNAPGPAFAVAVGLVLAAAALAWLLRCAFGPPQPEAPAPSDASLSEKWYLGVLVGALLWVGLVPGGPKLFGVPIFDPGIVNVINSATGDLASAYAPPAPPSSSPRSPSAGSGASPAPAARPSP
jgi:NADH-quinone oxidoreductase subunit M